MCNVEALAWTIFSCYVPNALGVEAARSTVGDDSAGFYVERDDAAKLVRVVAWGFWSVTVATPFSRLIIESCRAVPAGSSLLLDLSQLKPMRDEGQAAFSIALTMLRGMGWGPISLVTTSHLTKLQLMRIIKQAWPTAAVEFI